MRTFIAISIPEEIRIFLKSLQDKLNVVQPDIKWVKPENIHLTIKFLGEVKEEKISLIKKIMDEVSRKINTFKISICSLDAFPKIKTPKVIWVGIDKGKEELKALAKIMEEELLHKLGIPKEDRPFTGHITLGRLRTFKNIEKLIEKLNLLHNWPLQENKEFIVDKINLYKSTLTPQGPIYEELYVKTLNTS